MEKEGYLPVHQVRSLQGVVSCGFRLYGKYFGRIFRSSWPQALAYALAVGASMTCYFSWLIPALFASQDEARTVALAWLGSLLLVFVCAVLLAFAGGVAPLSQHSRQAVIGRPRRWWGLWPWRQLARSPRPLLAMFTVTLRRRAGALMAIVLLMALVVAVATLLLQLPAVILAVANLKAAKGLGAGDAVDMPAHLHLLNFVTFSLCGFVQAFIHLATLYPLYYLWGSAQADAQPKHPHA